MLRLLGLSWFPYMLSFPPQKVALTIRVMGAEIDVGLPLTADNVTFKLQEPVSFPNPIKGSLHRESKCSRVRTRCRFISVAITAVGNRLLKNHVSEQTYFSTATC